MSRSAQSQEPRRTIAKTTARGRPPVTSLRKVLSATRRAMPPRLPRREKHLGQPSCRAHRPATKIVLLVAHRTPRPHRPACRAAAKKSGQPHATPCRRPTADRQSARCMAATPRPAPHENSPVSRTPHAAPPSPRPSHFRAQSGQPRKNWAAPDRTHRPSPAAKTIRQQRPRPKARAPPYGRGARFRLSVSFLPLKMAAARNRKGKRRTIAKTTARGRPPVTSLRKVLSATRRAMPPRLPRREKHLGQPPCRTHRPRPATKIVLLVARRTPRPHRPARHISAHNPANRAKIGQHPTGRTAPAPPQKQSGSSAPPSQSARPRPYGRGARSPFVRFVPSSSMSRSAQSQEPRRTIAKTTARGRPPVTSLRKVLSATRRAMPPRLPRRKKRLGQPPCRAHRPATKIVLLVARRTPRPHRPARHISAHNPANRAKIGQHPTVRTAPAPP